MSRAWLVGVLLACLAGALAADDEGEWDPSGEFRRPAAGDAVKPQEPPTSVGEVLKGIQSQKLKNWFRRIQVISAEAGSGEFAASLEKAQAARRGVANEPATQADIPGRAVILALADAVVGELQALLGKTRDGVSTLADAERAASLPDLQALLAAAQGYCYLLDLDLDEAVRRERNGMRLAPGAVQPVLAGVDELFNGDPAQAYRMLKATFGKGSQEAYARLYGAAAALALGRDAEAAQYWEQAKDAVGYLPDYYLVGGFVAAADGDLSAARSRFTSGAKREHGRYAKCACLAAVADLALGKGDPAALEAALGHAPPTFRVVGAELLADPSADKAREALRHCAWWLNRNSYAVGQLTQASVTAEPMAWPTPAGETPPPPAVAPAQPQPDAAVAAPAAPAAPQGAAEPQPSAVVQESLASAAAAAYRSAQKLLGAGKLPEAEAALRSAVRLHPRLAEAWYALGYLHSLRNDYADAMYDYATALRIVPDWADAAYGLAQAEDRLGAGGEAARWYDRAVQLGLQGPAADYARSRAAALGRGR